MRRRTPWSRSTGHEGEALKMSRVCLREEVHGRVVIRALATIVPRRGMTMVRLP